MISNENKMRQTNDVYKNGRNYFSVRGVLGSTVMFCYNIGMILAFVLGAYCEYGTTPKVVIGLTIFFAVSFYFLPETPTVLIKQNKLSVRNHNEKFT